MLALCGRHRHRFRPASELHQCGDR